MGSELDEIELSQQEQPLKKGQCPVQEFYDLKYDRETVLNSGEMGGGDGHLEWNEEEGSALPFGLRAEGKSRMRDWRTRSSSMSPVWQRAILIGP
jgi:hypothetical protein